MIKMSLMITRRPDLSYEQFADYWVNVHWPKVLGVPEVREHCRRYVQLHNTGFTPDGVAAAPYDGIAEAWWDDIDTALAVVGSANWAAVVKTDDEHFLDTSKTVVLFSEEKIDYVQADDAG